ncbi:MAG: hypothetical protein LC714_09595, partial [Actinobacteria bacterium]|nr:hypothetical protein [Actinomycetota bacterium]
MVGRALEMLLQGASYDTRLIEEPTRGKPEELLQDVQLLLVAPTPSTKSRVRFLDSMASTPGTATMPVLTLSTVVKRALAEQTGLVPWPFRTKDLKAEIEGTLFATSETEACAKPEQDWTSTGRSPGADGPSPAGSVAQHSQLDGPDGRLGAV